MAMRKSGEGWWRGVLLLAGPDANGGRRPAHAVQMTTIQGDSGPGADGSDTSRQQCW